MKNRKFESHNPAIEYYKGIFKTVLKEETSVNKARRERLHKVLEDLEAIRLDLERIAEEEEETYDNLPKGIQSSERGKKAYENYHLINGYADKISSMIDDMAKL